ncbi:efflux RND transporter periplasmic adaptor subunit [Pseudooceanicola sp.]|uniref:efflux RND transporter periplasmic adaptor subunit n=1 Tax=Pseudooceanicola sp. TaxID=1914328 RepID=UPI00260420CD|nr:efflux RND transporter periplasmic adaptor subunit [Pseudooceanicola sp.]MDF1857045.1 efflux RND transporter periplasmic adaptor subunit [Pseudooceanicola sp.]
MIKRFVIAFLFLSVAVGGVVGFNKFRDQAIKDFFANRPIPALPVDTVIAKAGPWTPTLEAIGTVYARRGIDLAVETGGVVREVGFAANDRVEQGQVLVRIADEIEQADLAAARASLQLAEQTLARAASLRDRGIAAAARIEEAEAAANSARAQMRRIEAVLDQKVLESPFAGEIGIPKIEEGQFVTVGSTVATLQDTDRLRVDFSLPEQKLAQIDIGQSITLVGESGATASGSITGIEPRIDPATRLVEVRAELDNEDQALSPGQFVRVRVTLPDKENVVALPQTAVVTSLYGDYVYAVVPAENNTEEEPRLVANQVFVRTGSRQKDLVEIVDGVAAGDRIIVAGQNRLSNGVPVMLVGGAAPELPPEAGSETQTQVLPPEPERDEDADGNPSMDTGAAQAAGVSE